MPVALPLERSESAGPLLPTPAYPMMVTLNQPQPLKDRLRLGTASAFRVHTDEIKRTSPSAATPLTTATAVCSRSIKDDASCGVGSGEQRAAVGRRSRCRAGYGVRYVANVAAVRG